MIHDVNATGVTIIWIEHVVHALLQVAKRLVVTEELEDDYPVSEHPEEQEAIAAIVDGLAPLTTGAKKRVLTYIMDREFAGDDAAGYFPSRHRCAGIWRRRFS